MPPSCQGPVPEGAAQKCEAGAVAGGAALGQGLASSLAAGDSIHPWTQPAFKASSLMHSFPLSLHTTNMACLNICLACLLVLMLLNKGLYL